MTHYIFKVRTVVELSLSRFFKRQYDQLFKAIIGYLTSRQNKKARTEERVQARSSIKSFLFESAIERDNGVYLLAIDITGNMMKYSLKSEGRSYIHSDCIGGISIGHNYSVIWEKR